MKRALLFIVLLLSLSAMAQQWQVEQVPNTRLQSNLIHVSDPDSIIDDTFERQINAICSQVQDSVDMFVVALNNIDSDSKEFATRLFNHWGIGDKQKDNGLLILVVMEGHYIEFETGYGTECFFPDVLCKHVMDSAILPFFHEDKYAEGLEHGVREFARLAGGLSGAQSIAPFDSTQGIIASYAGVTYPRVGAIDTLGGGIFCLIASIFSFGGLLVFFFNWYTAFYTKKNKGKAACTNTAAAYSTTGDGCYLIDITPDSKQTIWSGNAWEHLGCLRYVVICLSSLVVLFLAISAADSQADEGLSSPSGIMWWALFGWLTFICVVHNSFSLCRARKKAQDDIFPYRVFDAAKGNLLSLLTMVCAPWVGVFFWLAYRKRSSAAKSIEGKCPICGKPIKKSNKQEFSSAQEKESSIGSISYAWYTCTDGHSVLVKQDGKNYKHYSDCPHCHARTRKEMGQKTIVEPTYTSVGKRSTEFHCLHCGKDDTVLSTLPKLERSSAGTSSAGGSWSGGGSSGGSFGGGMSGGGGVSGRW